MLTGQSLNQVCLSKLDSARSRPNPTVVRTDGTGLIPPDFLDAILRRWPRDLIGVILFGSAARGDATENSDVDLLLVMEPELKIVRDLYRLWEEFYDGYQGAQHCGRISPHFVGLPGSVQEAGGLWYETAIEGIVLWENERRVSRFLGLLREAMGQGRIRRRMLHGSPYWIKGL